MASAPPTLVLKSFPLVGSSHGNVRYFDSETFSYPRQITYGLPERPQPRTRFVPSNGSVCTRCVMRKRPPSPLSGPGSFRTAFVPRCFSQSPLAPNHGYGFQTTKGAGRCPLLIECHHRSIESRERDIWHRASQGRILFCQCPLDDDKGMLLPTLR